MEATILRIRELRRGWMILCDMYVLASARIRLTRISHAGKGVFLVYAKALNFFDFNRRHAELTGGLEKVRMFSQNGVHVICLHSLLITNKLIPRIPTPNPTVNPNPKNPEP